MLHNKIKYFFYSHLFFKLYFSKRMSVFLNENLFSFYLLNLTFYNDRSFNFLSNKTNLDKFGVIF